MSSPFKRFISTLMTIVMVIAMAPSQAFATSENGGEDETLVSAGSFDLDFVEGTEPVSSESSVFSGRVVDMYGQGMSDVSVQIYDQDENMLLALCSTDQSGAWTSAGCDAMEGHTCIVRFYKAGYSFRGNLLECIAMFGENNVGDVTAMPDGNDWECLEYRFLFRFE